MGRHGRLGVEREPQVTARWWSSSARWARAGARSSAPPSAVRRWSRPASASGIGGRAVPRPQLDRGLRAGRCRRGRAPRRAQRLRERGLPGVVYAASPAAGEVAGVAGELGPEGRRLCCPSCACAAATCVRAERRARGPARHRRRGSARRRRRPRRRLRAARRLVPAAARRRLSPGAPPPTSTSAATTAGRWPWPASRRSAPSPASTRWGRATRTAAAAPAPRRCRRRSTTS